MTFDKVNRRTHLYLGIFLTPWFLLYAASSVILNHGAWFQRSTPAAKWTRLFEQPYRLGPITEDSDPWPLAEKILQDRGLRGRYRASFDDDENLVVERNRFLSTIRVTYYPDKGRLVGEEKKLGWNEFLTAAHFRAGFTYPYFLEWLWAIFIDLVVLATLVWIASGIYMWVRLRRFRLWGWLAIAAGTVSFALIVLHM